MSILFGNQLLMLCIRISRKHQKLLMLFISIMCLSNLLWGFHLLGPEGLPLSARLSSLSDQDTHFENNNHTSTSNTFPACEKGLQTSAESEHLRPMDVSKIQYKRVLEAEHVVAYIV